MAGKKLFHLTVAPVNDNDGTPSNRLNKRRNTGKTPSSRPNTSHNDSKSNPKKATMIVGVDFGTTYSGFATAMAKSQYKDVIVNKSWPRCPGYQLKVPSMLSYNMTNATEPKVTAWGYETKSSENTYTWFKLGLGQNQAQEEYDDELLYTGFGSIKRPANLTYNDLATDYLRNFYDHLLDRLKTQLGDDTFDLLAFHFVLAVPAGWPDESRRAIQSCAERAGFTQREGDTISLIAEPEAAALATFHSYASTIKFKVDSNVMIVDMGGGTVDLITYTIKKLKPFRVAEACVGSGAKCGSTTIDRHFQKMMEDRFGEEYTSKSAKMIGPKSNFMNELENVKRRFDDETDTDAIQLGMNLETSDYYDADDGEVILKSDDLAQLFRPVVEKVKGLINEQIQLTKAENKFPISAIILCGGLAESKYIKSRLKEFCRDSVPDAQVLVPPNPWSAICCGAAMRVSGSNTITSRQARRSYGTVLLEPFIEGEHKKKNAITHPELGLMVQKMYWHITKNEKVHRNEKQRWLKNSFLHIGGQFGYEGFIEIYQSDNVDPPMWKADKGVKRLGHLAVNLSDLNGGSKRKKRASATYIPESENDTELIKVEIGQVIKNFLKVEFTARVGSRKVGTASFEYEPRASGEESEDEEEQDEEEDENCDNPDYWLLQPFNAE